MNKQKIQLIVVGAGIVIFIFVLAGNLKNSKSQKSAVTSVSPDNSTAVVAPVSSETVKSRPTDNQAVGGQKKRAELSWGRDPFVSELDEKEQISELKLQGISFGKDQTGFIFINNEIFKKGDKIGDYEVVEVFKDKVLLKKEEQTFYLTFPEE
jgi:hypothetical protein